MFVTIYNQNIVFKKISLLVFSLLVCLYWSGSVGAEENEQTPTQTITATFTTTFVPTPTVGGAHVYVPERVNVRSGPGTYYEKVGVLVAGQVPLVVGRTSFGEWIAIQYPEGTSDTAWVYSPLVLVRGITVEELPTVESPPTPTLQAVPVSGSVNPEYTSPPTRLPTFTPAPPIPQPTFSTPEFEGGSLPPIILIASLFTLGIVSGVVAIYRQRG